MSPAPPIPELGDKGRRGELEGQEKDIGYPQPSCRARETRNDADTAAVMELLGTGQPEQVMGVWEPSWACLHQGRTWEITRRNQGGKEWV